MSSTTPTVWYLHLPPITRDEPTADGEPVRGVKGVELPFIPPPPRPPSGSWLFSLADGTRLRVPDSLLVSGAVVIVTDAKVNGAPAEVTREPAPLGSECVGDPPAQGGPVSLHGRALTEVERLRRIAARYRRERDNEHTARLAVEAKLAAQSKTPIADEVYRRRAKEAEAKYAAAIADHDRQRRELQAALTAGVEERRALVLRTNEDEKRIERLHQKLNDVTAERGFLEEERDGWHGRAQAAEDKLAAATAERDEAARLSHEWRNRAERAEVAVYRTRDAIAGVCL